MGEEEVGEKYNKKESVNEVKQSSYALGSNILQAFFLIALKLKHE